VTHVFLHSSISHPPPVPHQQQHSLANVLVNPFASPARFSTSTNHSPLQSPGGRMSSPRTTTTSPSVYYYSDTLRPNKRPAGMMRGAADCLVDSDSGMSSSNNRSCSEDTPPPKIQNQLLMMNQSSAPPPLQMLPSRAAAAAAAGRRPETGSSPGGGGSMRRGTKNRRGMTSVNL
jgi:hypothetical protein